MRTAELVAYLTDYLDCAAMSDYSGAQNGLQVEGAAEIHTLATAVDACQFTIDAAARLGAQMLLVHHGLFWAGSAPIAGLYGQRVRKLVRADMNLVSMHLPLDVHPEVGNNAVLMRRLQLEVGAPFAFRDGVPVGLGSDARLTLQEISVRLSAAVGTAPRIIATGPPVTRRIGVSTGAASSLIGQAAVCGIDTLITGEAPHHAYFEAEERGINLVLAGHYATETVGVQALGDHLETLHGLHHEFIDHPTGL